MCIAGVGKQYLDRASPVETVFVYCLIHHFNK